MQNLIEKFKKNLGANFPLTSCAPSPDSAPQQPMNPFCVHSWFLQLPCLFNPETFVPDSRTTFVQPRWNFFSIDPSVACHPTLANGYAPPIYAQSISPFPSTQSKSNLLILQQSLAAQQAFHSTSNISAVTYPMPKRKRSRQIEGREKLITQQATAGGTLEDSGSVVQYHTRNSSERSKKGRVLEGKDDSSYTSIRESVFTQMAEQAESSEKGEEKALVRAPLDVNMSNLNNESLAAIPAADDDDLWDSDSESLEDYKREKYHKKLKNVPREWEKTHYGSVLHRRFEGSQEPSQEPRQAVEFSVMSYNILSHVLQENHPYLYSGESNRSLKWRKRRRRLVAEIAYHDPDILNLQEVERDQFHEYLKPRLQQLGYTGSYVKRSSDKTDGCVTMWKRSRFRLLRTTPVSFCRGGLLDRDNIAIITELQPIRYFDNGQKCPVDAKDKLVVSNTHLLFNPKRGDVKLAQLMVLLAEVDKRAFLHPQPQHPSSSSQQPPPTGPYCPIILTGDFNMLPESDLFHFMLRGRLDYEGLLVRWISGQSEGAYGRNVYLHRNFFSPMYGVTDFCQYYSAVVERLRSRKEDKTLPPGKDCSARDEKVSESLCQNELETGGDSRNLNSVRDCANSQTPAKDGDSKDRSSSDASFLNPSKLMNTGRVIHRLNLVSAYNNRIQRLGNKWGVTTHHNRGKCAVDYIFYSVKSKEIFTEYDEIQSGNVRQGDLKLLARYGLMSEAELDEMGGIPNPRLPSDHLCLITKFLLK